MVSSCCRQRYAGQLELAGQTDFEPGLLETVKFAVAVTAGVRDADPRRKARSNDPSVQDGQGNLCEAIGAAPADQQISTVVACSRDAWLEHRGKTAAEVPEVPDA